MSLLGPAQVRELASRHGIHPTKKLGQNFVIDPNTVRKIVRLAGVSAQDLVLEIGPGLGSLTLGLTEAQAQVTAVEIDPRLARQLPETLADMQPENQGLLRVIHSDALDLTHDQLVAGSAAPEVLVANLPYNVSVPILMHLLHILPSLNRGLVMVQSEVGMRIAAGAGSAEYGAPSAKAAWYGEFAVAATVSRNIFWPVPGVDSVLVSYAKHKQPMGSETERVVTFDLINAAFQTRRKMIRQSLQGVASIPAGAEAASLVIEQADLAPTARAEELSVADYLRLARSLIEHPEPKASERSSS